MVLPGIQALFGFQLIAVFNNRFDTELTSRLQFLHFTALILVAVSVGLVMAPAAYHRQTGPRQVTEHFVQIASRLLLLGMVPLAAGICLDVYVIAHLIARSPAVSAAVAGGLFLVFAALWWALPRTTGRKEKG